MRISPALLTLTLLAVAAPALAIEIAAPPAAAALERAPREGEVLRDSQARIVGKVAKVQVGGAILVIVDRGTVRVPANSLSIVDGRLITTLTKSEARRLK